MERTNRPTRILANDPSLTAWGYAVLDTQGKVIHTGCIKTAPENKKRRIRKGDDNVRRISEINRTLKVVVKEYNVEYFLVELPHGSQNANAMKMIGMVAGICQTISDWQGIPIEWYSEGDAKKFTLGKQTATKREMINQIAELYDVPWTGIKYKDEAIADALAIHNVAMQLSPTISFLKRHK